MLERAGAAPGDSEGLIDHLRSIAGVDAVALIRELPDGNHKVSLRSRGELDIEKIARHHGGGGHRNAAGYAVDGDGAKGSDIGEIQQQAVAALAAALADKGAAAEA
jgi:phosphoesterase RecJ-like protein